MRILCNFAERERGGGGSENNDLHKLCSKSNSITLCRSPGMRNQVKTQKERSEGGSFSKILGIICLEGGLRRIGFKIICFKSNYIMFYRSLGMPIEVETRKEGCQGKSFSKILCIICLKGGGESENNRFQNSLLQIQFYHIL